MNTFLEFVKQYTAPSKAIRPDDLENLHKAAEIVREFTKQNGARFIERRKDKPILVQYGSDLTPLTHRHRLHEEAEGLSVTKNGKSSNEFLVQRCIITDLHGDACTVLEEPLILTRKTAWSHFCAERQLLKTPRELGHTGLAVSSHKFDGALQQTLKRLFRKWQQVYDDDQEEKLGRTKAYRLWIRNWYESETCAAHFLNGGLKWALMPYIDDPEVLKSAFIVMESCCNGHNLIQEFIGRWILAVMTFTSTAWPEAREFYSTWSLKEETLETAVDLEVRFQDGKLLVSEKHRERLGLIDLLVVFLLKVWMFARWLEIAACWTDPNFSKANVMALEQDDGRILETPGDVVLRALESIQLYAADKTPARKPLWLPLLCWNRGDFASYILNIVDFATGAEGFYKTTFALQNPLIAGFIPLEEVLEPDALVADVGYQRAMLENHDHTFKYIAPLDFIFSDDDRLTTASGVQVLPHAKAIGNQTLVVNGDWRTFEGWVSRH